jgi:RHH-type proline utilization regulon transcriptional repressor/proline dehydrogenase/delta 1-pyrroline-5-carboxylate dehydrogenase
MALFRRTTKPAAASAASPVKVSGGLESRIFEIGSDLLARARSGKAGLLSAKFYSDALMNWSMKDHQFKVQLFRFVDCFPMLKTPEQIYEHLSDYLGQPGVKAPPGMELLLKAGGLMKGAAAGQIARQIEGMASRFIAGRDAADALPALRALWDEGIAFSVDLLGEACLSDEEADEYQRRYLDLVQTLPAEAAGWKPQPVLESDHLGPIPRVNVSIKISSLSPRCDAIDTEGAIGDLMGRLVPILEAARDRGVFVNFDMEQHALKDLTIEAFQRCCERVDFQAGLAMQAYLRSGVEDARRVCEWARRTGRIVSVRLVKGAYWDYETIHAEMKGWPCPVWNAKWQTDACFERMTEVLLDGAVRGGPAGASMTRRAAGQGGVRLALGSHNVRSIAAALAGAEARGLPRQALELQMLHGMADPLKHAARELGLRVREYVPVGEMIPGMAYLVRRLLENTSNESWLRAGFADNADVGVLLRAPGPPEPGRSPPADLSVTGAERHQLSPAPAGVGDGRPFVNEPPRDFADARQRQAFAGAIARATVPRVPSDRSPEDARRMVGRAVSALGAWRDADPRLRARVLTLAAERMRRQRDGLAAVMIREAGKTWREADADVCEAIDFCEYYARCAVPLFERARVGRFIGELNEVWHEPRGVAVVISPWNFPLAICCGMTVAALVTGNPTIVKPAEQTTGIASIMCDILWESIEEAVRVGAGSWSPPGEVDGAPFARAVLQFCPGPGETTGAALVRDERVALIAFTGSRDVGMDIVTAAGPGSPFADPSLRDRFTHLKHVVCEMGGKNAVIIDTSADLDEAVAGVRSSAFGFQGQKCSACSRCIVVDPDGPEGPAARLFTRRLVEATRALVIGDPALPGTDVGPVIDDEARRKILGYIERAKGYARLELAMSAPEGLEERTGRCYVGPHIFSGVRTEHELAREEVFGPVLALMHAPTFDAALRIANAVPYRLTGGVYTRRPAHIERARREFRVGNLYINRGCTGALVARQPFGGFGASGGGTKAGGAEYLLHFVVPRAVTENTLRRGFAPEL